MVESKQMTIIFDGRELAKKKEEKLKSKVEEFKKKTGITPKLVSFLVGNDPASELYTRIKQKAAERVGIEFLTKRFSADVHPDLLLKSIEEKNTDSTVHGILVQLPLPSGSPVFSFQFSVLNSIAPAKDVDCLTPENLGLLMMKQPRFLPATVKGIMEIINQLSNYRIANWRGIKGTDFCLVGTSPIVGKPLAVHLRNLGATVTMCGRNTNLIEHTRRAEVIVSSTGVPGLITKQMVRPGVIIIDVGSPKGDVDFEAVKEISSLITPVPGGVGPMTVISLLENTLQAATQLTEQPIA